MSQSVFVFQDGSRIDAPPVFDCKRNDYVMLSGKRYQVMGRLHIVSGLGTVTEIHITETDVTIGLWSYPLAEEIV